LTPSKRYEREHSSIRAQLVIVPPRRDDLLRLWDALECLCSVTRYTISLVGAGGSGDLASCCVPTDLFSAVSTAHSILAKLLSDATIARETKYRNQIGEIEGLDRRYLGVAGWITCSIMMALLLRSKMRAAAHALAS